MRDFIIFALSVVSIIATLHTMLMLFGALLLLAERDQQRIGASFAEYAAVMIAANVGSVIAIAAIAIWA